jgi:hypothetical protein
LVSKNLLVLNHSPTCPRSDKKKKKKKKRKSTTKKKGKDKSKKKKKGQVGHGGAVLGEGSAYHLEYVVPVI